MSNIEMWALVAGFLSPPVIALIQQTHWREQLRALLTFVWSLVLGAITLWINGGFTGHRYVEVALTILVTAIATYKGLWKPTSIAPKIEAATTIGGPKPTGYQTTPPRR